MNLLEKHSTVQRLVVVYAVVFFGIVALNYVPGIHDESGKMFGLFRLDPIDDAIHLVSALWATFAAWYSTKESVRYFKVFGLFYFFDGIICLLFGQCLADGTIVTHRHGIELLSVSNLVERLMLNIPHIVIGGAALWIGWYFSKKIKTSNYVL